MYYQVSIFDKYDCISHVEEFDDLEEAQEFAENYKNALVECVEE